VGWLIGGFFSWSCISIIGIGLAVSKRIKPKGIDVLNADRAGGFSLMGSVAMRSALLYIFSVSLMLPGWIFSTDISQGVFQLSDLLLIGVLISLGIIEFGLFLLPMWFFHKHMKKAKRECLSKLNVKIADLYSHLAENRVSERDSQEILSTLALREEADLMHEYPFNPRMLAKVGSSAIIPVLLVLPLEVIQFVTNLLNNNPT